MEDVLKYLVKKRQLDLVSKLLDNYEFTKPIFDHTDYHASERSDDLMWIMLIDKGLVANPERLNAWDFTYLECTRKVCEALYPVRKDNIRGLWISAEAAENYRMVKHLWRLATDSDKDYLLENLSDNKNATMRTAGWLIKNGIKPPAGKNLSRNPWLANFYPTEMPLKKISHLHTFYHQSVDFILAKFKARVFPEDVKWWLSPECLFAKVETASGLLMVTVAGVLLNTSVVPPNAVYRPNLEPMLAGRIYHSANKSGGCEISILLENNPEWIAACLKVANAIHSNDLAELIKLMNDAEISKEIEYISLIPLFEYNECLEYVINEKCYTEHHYQQIATICDNQPHSYYHSLLVENVPQLRPYMPAEHKPFDPKLGNDDYDECSIDYNHALLGYYDSPWLFDSNEFCSAHVVSGKLESGEKFRHFIATGDTFVRESGIWRQDNSAYEHQPTKSPTKHIARKRALFSE